MTLSREQIWEEAADQSFESWYAGAKNAHVDLSTAVDSSKGIVPTDVFGNRDDVECLQSDD